MRPSEPGMNSCISLNPVSVSSLSSAVLIAVFPFNSLSNKAISLFRSLFTASLQSHPPVLYSTIQSPTFPAVSSWPHSLRSVSYWLLYGLHWERVHNCSIEDCIKSNTAFTHTPKFVTDTDLCRNSISYPFFVYSAMHFRVEQNGKEMREGLDFTHLQLIVRSGCYIQESTCSHWLD